MSDFSYKLNAMEHASQAEHPDKMGYADKRKAVLGHVAELEAKLARYENVSGLPEYPQILGDNQLGQPEMVYRDDYDKLHDYAVAMKVENERVTQMLEQVQALAGANIEVQMAIQERAEKAEVALTTARREERERIIEVCRDHDCHRAIKLIEALTDEVAK